MKIKGWWMRVWALALAAAVTAGCGGGAVRDGGETADYPNRPIELVVPFSAGGGVDLVARAAADYLSRQWGQTVVVVNKPGGGGTIGAEYALKQAAADGYTVLADNVSTTTMLDAAGTNPVVTLSDHEFVARIGKGTLAFAVKADAPWKDFREFSEWVKTHPEELTWTSVGPAGTSSFAVAEWLDRLGVDYRRTRMIVTKGASDSLPKVAGGHAVLAVHTIGEVYPLLQAGKVKVLAVSGKERSPYLPDVPTAEEQGITGLTVSWWTGISMPKGTPEAVIRKWETATEQMVNDPGFVQKLEAIQVEGSYAGTSAFNADVTREAEYYRRLAERCGLRK